MRRVYNLFITNLLESSRSRGTNHEKKNYTRKNVVVRNIGFQVIAAVAVGFMLGLVMKNFQVYSNPQVFSVMISSIFVLGMFMNMFTIYSTFMDEASVVSYMALPYTFKEIFMAKFLTVALNSLASYLPLIFMLTGTGLGAGRGWLYSLPTALLSTSLIYLFGFFLTLFISYYIFESSFFKKHKRKIRNVLAAIAIIIVVALELIANEIIDIPEINLGGVSGVSEVFTNALSFIMDPFRKIYVKSEMTQGWLGVGAWLIALAVMALITFKDVVPKLFIRQDQTGGKVSEKVEVKKPKKSSSDLVRFIKYQLDLAGESTVHARALVNKLYIPMFFILPKLKDTTTSISQIISFNMSEASIYLIVGILLGLASMLMPGISPIIISLEGENYNYIKSLPFSLEKYLRNKFWFAYVYELLTGIIGYIPVVFLLDVPLEMVVLALVGYAVSVYLMTLYYFRWDFRNLSLNWTSVEELNDRSGFTVIQIIIVGVVSVVFVAALLAIIYSVYKAPLTIKWVITSAVVAITALVVLLTNSRDNKKFWPNVIVDNAN